MHTLNRCQSINTNDLSTRFHLVLLNANKKLFSISLSTECGVSHSFASCVFDFLLPVFLVLDMSNTVYIYYNQFKYGTCLFERV